MNIFGRKEVNTCDCFGKPILWHTRAEYECDECTFERECEAVRKEGNT